MDPEEQSISEQPPQYPWLHTLADAVGKAGDWLEDETPKKSNVNQWILEHLNRPLINAQVEGLARPVQRMAEHAAYGDKNAWVSGSGETTQITPDAMVVAPMIAGGLTGFKKIAAEALSELGTTGSAMGKAGQRGIFTLEHDPKILEKADELKNNGASDLNTFKSLNVFKDPGTGKWLKEISDYDSKSTVLEHMEKTRPTELKTRDRLDRAALYRTLLDNGQTENGLREFYRATGEKFDDISLQYAKNHTREELQDMRENAASKLYAPMSMTMADAFHHPELFKEHPEIASLTFEAAHPDDVGGFGGHYDKSARTVRQNADNVNIPGETKKTILHELAHYIQDKEGRDPGAHPDVIYSAKNDAVAAKEAAILDQYKQGMITHSKMSEMLSKLPRKLSKDDAFRLYMRNIGETEARAVEERSSMAPFETMFKHPLESYDRSRGPLLTMQDLYDPNVDIPKASK